MTQAASSSASAEASSPSSPRIYPPYGHILRHIELDQRFDGSGTLFTSMPAPSDLFDAGGYLRVGALAVLVDAAAGVLSHEQVRPDWLATTDMKLHCVRPTAAAGIESTTRVIRAGKRTILTESILGDEDGEVARAWVTYARLPRRDDTPEVETDHESNRRIHHLEDPEIERANGRPPLDDYIGMRFDPNELVIEVEHNPRIRNSFGSIQGGVVAALVERMSTLSAERTLGRPARALDLHVHYLEQSTTGPFRIEGNVLRVEGRAVTTQVSIIDASDRRLLDLATATAAA